MVAKMGKGGKVTAPETPKVPYGKKNLVPGKGRPGKATTCSAGNGSIRIHRERSVGVGEKFPRA